MKPCRKCGATERAKKSKRCLPCHRSYNANKRLDPIYREKNRLTSQAWRAANPERYKAVLAAYCIANKEKRKEVARRCREKNKENNAVARKEWQKKNKEKINTYNREYRAKNNEKIREYYRVYLKNNPACRIYKLNRRMKLQEGGTLSKDLIIKLYKRQKGKCICCKQPLEKDYHLDHIMPLALGGKNEDWNMQLLRKKCNQQKSARHPIEYMQSRGFLL